MHVTGGSAAPVRERGQDVAATFGIRAWSACGGDLRDADAWRAWSATPRLLAQAEAPALPEMAPMLRRRVPLLGRVALASAYGCPPGREGIPVVFASRHGDTGRLLEMLKDLAAGEALSPTAFGLSVHNATGALRSIDRADPANLQALSAGRDTVEMAVLEACSLLAEGAPEVLLVYYEAPLAQPYQAFADEPDCLHSWCWRIGQPREGEPAYSLSLAGKAATEAGIAPQLPHGLDVLRFVLAGDAELTHAGENATWRWRRHG